MDLYIRHNVEMAHRLLNLPGKCQQIHGHSLKVKVSWIGGVNADGYFTLDDGSVMDFSNAKRVVRKTKPVPTALLLPGASRTRATHRRSSKKKSRLVGTTDWETCSGTTRI
jgi:hypothetical protein